MATNLMIASCGIPNIAGTTISTLISAGTSTPIGNLFGGNKADNFALASASSGDISMQFITPGAPGDFLYIGKASTLKNGGVGTITLKASNGTSYGDAATVANLTGFGSYSLVGPEKDDLIFTFTSPGASTYWWVNYNAPSASLIQHSKLFFGTALDIGKDPTSEVKAKRLRPIAGRRGAAYTLDITWEGLPYAATTALYRQFYRPRRYQPVILFTRDYHDILFGHQVLFGRILEMKIPPRATNFNDVSMTFEELV